MYYAFYLDMAWNYESQSHSLVSFDARRIEDASFPNVAFDTDDYPSPGLSYTLYFYLPQNSALGRALWTAARPPESKPKYNDI
jgi:hypothetical protein